MLCDQTYYLYVRTYHRPTMSRKRLVLLIKHWKYCKYINHEHSHKQQQKPHQLRNPLLSFCRFDRYNDIRYSTQQWQFASSDNNRLIVYCSVRLLAADSQYYNTKDHCSSHNDYRTCDRVLFPAKGKSTVFKPL